MILDLGLIAYEDAYRTQKEFVRLRKIGEIEDSLILAEHYPVFTIGRTGKLENLLVDESALDGQGVKVLRVDRGGDVTFHGPGQLVIYPIMDLGVHGRDLHRYMRILEQFIIDLLEEYAIRGQRFPGRTGVWVGGQKLASIGIAATNWVTYHGASLNVNVDLKFFSMINPCGMKAVKMTSLEKLLGGKVNMLEVKGRIADAFSAVLA